MRILHLYSGNLYGGIERVLVTMAQADGGVEQRFALFFDGRLAAELRGTGAAVEIVGPAALSRPWQILRARAALRRLLVRSRPDVVLAHSPWALAMAGAAIRHPAVHRALWLHNPPTRRWWPDALGLRGRAAPHMTLANSRFTADASAAVTRVDAWVHPPVAAPGPDAGAARTTVREELGATPRTVVILQASRIEPWKGLQVLIDALAQVRGLPDWMLWVAGGPQRRHERLHFEAVRTAVERHGLSDRVRFLGHRHDVPQLMAAADVYAQANLEPEPFGVSLIEAMAAGLPVVTTEAGGLAGEIAGVCGTVVPADDPGALAQVIADLIGSPDRRAALGRRGPAVAAELCDPARQIARLRTALEQHT